MRIDAEARIGELGHVGAAYDHEAGAAQPRDHGRVGAGRGGAGECAACRLRDGDCCGVPAGAPGVLGGLSRLGRLVRWLGGGATAPAYSRITNGTNQDGNAAVSGGSGTGSVT